MTIAAPPRPGPRGTLGGSLHKYMEVARLAFANRMAYVGDALSRPLFFTLILFVFVQLWRRVFSADRPVVAGYSLADTLWYLVMTEAILLSAPRLDGRVDEEVKTGSVAFLLGRPCHYVLYHLAQCLGESVPLFAVNLVAGTLVACLMVGPLHVVWSGVPLAACAVLLAFALHFYVSMSLALLAFWVEDATPFFWVYSKMLFILGGLMIPLEFFPGWLQSVAGVLPFRHILSGPARLVVHFSLADALSLLAWQLAWLAGLAALAHGIFAVGIRRVHIQGG